MILGASLRNNSHLLVDGQCLLSEEGTRQGGLHAMAMYAIGTLPLIHCLDNIAKQAWLVPYSGNFRGVLIFVLIVVDQQPRIFPPTKIYDACVCRTWRIAQQRQRRGYNVRIAVHVRAACSLHWIDRGGNKAMALYRWLRPVDGVLDPKGPLSSSLQAY